MSNKEKDPVSVLFVPRTPNGELITRLREAEANITKVTGDKIKLVEKTGRMIKRIVHKSNPYSGENCGRQNCLA